MVRPACRWAGLLLLMAWMAPATPAWIEPELLSLRGGDNAGTMPQSFAYRELALRGSLPLHGRLRAWEVRGHLEVGFSKINSDGERAELYSLGPSLSFKREAFTVDFGISPGYLNQDEVNGRRFGGGLQFTSHLGVYVGPRRWQIGYRIQHTSNGRLYRYNDGLDLQMLDLWLRF